MTELVKIESMEQQQALVILSSEDQTKAIIQQIRDEATGEVPDLTTGIGRKRVASLAAKVAKSKTLIDGHGKELVKPIKEQAKAIDANRKILRDELDALKAEIRQPLTDWENAERERQEGHGKAIEYIQQLADERDVNGQPYDSGMLKSSLEEAESIELSEAHCQEYLDQYVQAKHSSVTTLKTLISAAEKREAEAAELEELRKLKAEQEQKERDEQLKREAAAKAEAEAEAAKEREAEAVRLAEEAEKRRIEAEKQAEMDRAEADKKAKEQAEAAAKAAKQAELDRQKAEQEQLAKERAEREANKKYVTKCNSEARNALMQLGLTRAESEKVVKAIVAGDIPNVTINY